MINTHHCERPTQVETFPRKTGQKLARNRAIQNEMSGRRALFPWNKLWESTGGDVSRPGTGVVGDRKFLLSRRKLLPKDREHELYACPSLFLDWIVLRSYLHGLELVDSL